MAPTISTASFSRSSFTIDAPIGPIPYCIARIFFFTMVSVPTFLAPQLQHKISPPPNLLAYWNSPPHSIILLTLELRPSALRVFIRSQPGISPRRRAVISPKLQAPP
jgi:hypothetical protein